MQNVVELVLSEIQSLETIGVIFGLISVWLTVKENVWCWSFGIVNVILFGWIFYQSTIYGQMLLQFFFLVLILYSWYEWLYGGEGKTNLSLSKVTPKQIIYSIPITIILTLIIQKGIQFVSEKENFTLLDSIVTSLSFTAQFFLAKKVLESWIIWIVVDILSICLFIQTGLYKIGFFYFLLLILATSGYITWKRKLVK